MSLSRYLGQLVDRLGNNLSVRGWQDSVDSSIAWGAALEVGAAVVSATNPVPVRQWNGITITQTVVPLAAATDAQLVAANANRRYLMVMNINTGDATLAFNGAAVAGSGTPLNAADAAGRQGGSMTWESGAITTDAVHAISTPGTTIVVLEGV